jgi:hypothetical protein
VKSKNKKLSKVKTDNKYVVSPMVVFLIILVIGISITTVWKIIFANKPDTPPRTIQNSLLEETVQSLSGSGKDSRQSTANNTQNPTKKLLEFSNPSSIQQGEYIVVSSELSELSSGTCKFHLEQTPSVLETTSTINNVASCGSRVPLSRVPSSGTWSVSIKFINKDGQTAAEQAAFNIYINK